MYGLKILILIVHLNLVTPSTSNFNLIWYEANKAEPHFYTARQEDSLEDATRIVLDQKISVLRSFDLGFAPNLKTLTMNNCGLTDIEPESFRNLSPLTELSITGNSIKTIKEGVFNYMDVQHLNLSFNKIRTITPTAFNNMNHLKSVVLDHNELNIYSLQFMNCPNITLISVRYNFLLYLPVDIFKELRDHKLDVLFSYNKIEEIHKNVFDVAEFGDFSLDHNELKYFDFSITKIHSLDLHENHIECLSDEFLKNELGKITVLNLKNNPTNCNCLQKFQNYNNVLLSPIEEHC